MRICHCMAVSDRTIRAAVRDGAESLDAVARACGAGSMCGGCRPAVADVMADCGVSAVQVHLRSTVRRIDVAVGSVVDTAVAAAL